MFGVLGGNVDFSTILKEHLETLQIAMLSSHVHRCNVKPVTCVYISWKHETRNMCIARFNINDALSQWIQRLYYCKRDSEHLLS